jgi:hypothetical protein
MITTTFVTSLHQRTSVQVIDMHSTVLQGVALATVAPKPKGRVENGTSATLDTGSAPGHDNLTEGC